MTNTALPIDASSGSPAYTSQQFRQAMSSLVANGTSRPIGGRSGYGPGHQPTVLTATTTTATIGPFSAIVDPAFTTTQGAYFISADANNTAAITAAPSSPNTRIDLLYAQVNDTAIDSSGSRNFTVGIVTGTAANPGLTPSLPARSFLLATINVPSSPGTPTITVNNTFSGGAGGVLPVSTAASLTGGTAVTNPFEGMFAYALDTNAAYYYNGSAWTLFAEDTGWTQPTLSNSWVSFDGGTTFAIPAYRRINGVVFLNGEMKLGTTSTTIFTLPSGYRPLKSIVFTASAGPGLAAIQVSSAGAVTLVQYAASGTNGSVNLSGFSFPAEQ